MKFKKLKWSILSLILLLGIGLNSQTFAQEVSIQGKVINKEGISLPGITIVIKGTSIGAVTDNSGRFSLQIPSNAKTLVFSFVGMRTQEVSIDGKTNFEITMEEEVIGIDDVVVVGYGVQKKVNLTGSVGSVEVKIWLIKLLEM